MPDTIFALSSGMAPAAIGVIRISGENASAALAALAGALPPAREARLRTLRDGQGQILDTALVLWFPGPHTATGEDLAELHCHGGRAVLAAVQHALTHVPGLRRAHPGEFTRRAFANGRIDLAEAEGLADLLSAETEAQRRNALRLAGGDLSRQVEAWREELLAISSVVEAALDFSDEGDVGQTADCSMRIAALANELGTWLARPHAETLRDGIRVVLAGPPNVGKSSLFNALVGSDAAITAPTAGTTRDVLTRPVALSGIPFVIVDTAGLRENGEDAIERIGIVRAREAVSHADIVLWLGSEGDGPLEAWEIEPKSDDSGHPSKRTARHRVSAKTGFGMDAMIRDLADCASELLPKPGDVALNQRQRAGFAAAQAALTEALSVHDDLIVAEYLRQARLAFDALLGRTAPDDLLDALFGRFCLGK